MQRFAFEIQYHGGKYVGWQHQLNGLSVQDKIGSIFNRLFNSHNINIIGCGRTDAGVHAHRYFFHVDLENKFDINQLRFKMNRMLPDDISISHIHLVYNQFHARFDAKERIYRYFIHQEKNPFLNDLSLFFPQKLNIKKMNEACEYLLGKQDFTSFSKRHTDVKTNICIVNHALWVKDSDHKLYFEISANRFLRNMVRAIVGTLIEVGLENIDPKEVKYILEKKNRNDAKYSVPAHGLFLWNIKYDKIS